MSVTNTITDSLSVVYTGNGKAVTAPVGSYTGTEAVAIETVITAGATNQHVVVPKVPYASIQASIMSADQNLTVKVNSSTTPTETFTLSKTAALVWTEDSAAANPYGHDISDLYVSNAGATDAKFHFRALIS